MNIELLGHNIIITNSAWNTLMSFMLSHTHDQEAGGILLGQVQEANIFILHFSFPNKFDKASKFQFLRDKDAAQVIVDFEFRNSNSKMIYLGEWHTHPEEYPTPSSQDLKMIQSQFKLNTLNEDFILLLIVGFKKGYLGIRKVEKYGEAFIDLILPSYE